MVTVLKEKGIFAGVNLFSKQDTMDITDMFKIPLFKNFTLKMREEFLDKLEYTVEEHLGVTRPALSKEIGRLVDEGFISITRRKVTILNKTALTCML